MPDMTKCCDKHDICYGTCGETRQYCDRKFRRCLEDICEANVINGKHSKKERKGGLYIYPSDPTSSWSLLLNTFEHNFLSHLKNM